MPKWKQGAIRFESVGVKCTPETWLAYLKSRGGDCEDVDLNWTYWDLRIRSVDVTLSLWRWLEGRGLLTDCRVQGVRGELDRRHVTWLDDWQPVLRAAKPGDFELDRFVIDDLLVHVRNPTFRYPVSLFHGELPRLRKQWLLYDVLSADHLVGAFDECLFSVHRPHTAASEPRAKAVRK